jgi:hypothetical protein
MLMNHLAYKCLFCLKYILYIYKKIYFKMKKFSKIDEKMAKSKLTIEIDYNEILDLIKSKYPEIKEEEFEREPFLDIKESGDHDRGNYKQKLKSITFYIKK